MIMLVAVTFLNDTSPVVSMVLAYRAPDVLTSPELASNDATTAGPVAVRVPVFVAPVVLIVPDKASSDAT